MGTPAPSPTPTPAPTTAAPTLAPPTASPAPPAGQPAAPPAAPQPPAAPTAPAPGAPEGYAAFELPEGFQIASEDLAAFTPLARELKLDQAGAQKFVSLATTFGQRILANDAARREQLTGEQGSKWRAEIEADPTLGGANMPQTVELVNRARAAFDPQNKIGELLAQHGLGDHPQLVRLFRQLGEALREDSPPPGSPHAPAQPKDVADLLYPNEAKRAP